MILFFARRTPITLLLMLAGATPAAQPKPLEFHVRFDEAVSAKPFTGRIYVLLSRNNIDGMPGGLNWFNPEPCFGYDVKNWKPGEVLVIDGAALACPAPLKELKPGTYSAVAVMDFGRGINFTRAQGNGYS